MMSDRFNQGLLTSELESAGAEIKGLSVKCPFHDDKSPSGSLYQDTAGVWRYKCHSSECAFGGDVYDVRAKVQARPLAEVLKESSPANKPPRTQKLTDSQPRVFPTLEAIAEICPGQVNRWHTYTNPATNKPDLIVLRFKVDGKKQFWQITPNHQGYYLKAPPGLHPLYNRNRLQAADGVIVVEGELCVERLHEAGFVGLTSPGGSGAAHKADWRPLQGKIVYLWPDFDEAGDKYMKDVAGILSRLDPAPTVYWIDPAALGLSAGGDVVDYLKVFEPEKQHSMIEALLSQAEPLGIARGCMDLVEATISGERRAVPWPWPLLSKVSQALTPGSIVVLCGAGGASKSLMLLQCLAYWVSLDIKVCCYELENDREYHLMRALAQHTNISGLTDLEWIRDHPEESRQALVENKDFLESLGRVLYEAPDGPVDLNQIAAWMESRAKDGCRVLCVDPITLVSKVDKTWVADNQFLQKVKVIARTYGVSVILITHPVKAVSFPSMHQLAGSSDYARLTSAILWLEHLGQEGKTSRVGTSLGTTETKHDRVVHILKTRDGSGTGLRIAFNFDRDSLTLQLEGIIRGKG